MDHVVTVKDLLLVIGIPLILLLIAGRILSWIVDNGQNLFQ